MATNSMAYATYDEWYHVHGLANTMAGDAPANLLMLSRMILRILLFWILGVGLAGADLPRQGAYSSLALPASVNFQYDANGNLTNDGTRVFTYDAENRLASVSVSNQWLVTNVYDGLGRRRLTTESTRSGKAWVITNQIGYIYDGMVVIQERDINNNPTATYTRGLDLSMSRQGAGGIGGLLARNDSNGPAVYHADANGNITALLDTNQFIAARYEYDPYGRLIGKWGRLADANRYRFSSKEYQPASGLYNFGYRFYEPNLSRWLNRDPIQEVGGINLYGFVGNNPISRVDPYGLINADRYEELEQQQAMQTGWNYQAGPDGTVTPAGEGGGLASTDLDFIPFLLPEIPAVSDALGAVGDYLGNAAKDTLDALGLGKPNPPVQCPVRKPTYLYQKVGANGEHLKFGVTKNPATRYTQAELGGGKLNIIAEGSQSDMLQLERNLHSDFAHWA